MRKDKRATFRKKKNRLEQHEKAAKTLSGFLENVDGFDKIS